MGEEKTYTAAEAHRFFGIEFNREVWGLLGKEDRTRDDEERMVYSAFASARHWLEAGTAVNQQRAEWMISHVYAELGLGESALRHAQRCQELTTEHGGEMEDFDRAYALEALARAHAVSGNRQEAEKHLKMANRAGQAIGDPESKEYFEGDLAGGNWAGFR
jgi:hypothetical protein